MHKPPPNNAVPRLALASARLRRPFRRIYMRRPRVRRSLAAALLVAVPSVAAAVALVRALLWPAPNLCAEGTEAPVYEAVAGGEALSEGLAPHYRLLRVRESSVPPAATDVRGLVLFVPGNAGAYTQAKSMAAEAAKAGLPLEFYTVDLGSELVAFRGELLARQVRFVRRALDALAALRRPRDPAASSTAPPRPVLLAVGHSMGGLVLRAALRSESADGPSVALDPRVALLLTLGTPNAAPVVATEASVSEFYAALARGAPAGVPVISVSGGERDVQVPAHLCELPYGLEPRGMHLPAQAVRGVRGSVDHQCLSWCLPLILRLNELLAEVAVSTGAAGAEHSAGAPEPASLLWEAPPGDNTQAVVLQPASAFRRKGPVSLPAGITGPAGGARERVNDGVGSHSNRSIAAYRLQLQEQWLAVPQQLTLQCVDDGSVPGQAASEDIPRLFLASSRSTAPASATVAATTLMRCAKRPAWFSIALSHASSLSVALKRCPLYAGFHR